MSLQPPDFLFPYSAKDVRQGASAPGYVYGMADAFNPEIVKLGETKKPPLARAKALNSQTASLGMLYVVFYFRCDSAYSHEQYIFKALKLWRIKRRKEFFRITPATACAYLSAYFDKPPDLIIKPAEDEFLKIFKSMQAV